MKRYVVRPRLAPWRDDGGFGADAEDYLARTVFEKDPSPQHTGLYDAYGEALFSVEEMDPVGFIRF